MDESLYSDGRLYDLMYPAATEVDVGTRRSFYLQLAEASGGPVLELGCGTGTVLAPIAARGIECEGIDLSEEMLTEARAKFEARGLDAAFHVGDMRNFDLDLQFAFIFITGNSLLHLHAASDIVSCFQRVRRHLAPSGTFALDVFNPSVKYLAGLDDSRREMQRFDDPTRGDVRVDVQEIYDSLAQVTRGLWYFSTDSDPDFRRVLLEIRSIFPQELPLLIAAGGLRLVERFGDFSGGAFTSESPQQVCVCEAV